MLNYKLMEFFDSEPEIVPDIAIKEEATPHYIGHRKRAICDFRSGKFFRL